MPIMEDSLEALAHAAAAAPAEAVEAGMLHLELGLYVSLMGRRLRQ